MSNSWKRRVSNLPMRSTLSSRLRFVCLILLMFVSFGVGRAASAQDGGPGTPGYTGPSLEIPIPAVEFSDIVRDENITVPWLAQYIGGVYTFLLSIAGLLAAVMMIVGGFQYVTSAGDSGKIGAAKKRITNALTGLLLAFGSYTILYTINPDLVAFEGLKIGVVQTELLADTQNASNEDGLIAGTVSGKAPSSLCNSQSSCQVYCDKFFQSPQNIPQVSPGMAAPQDVETIENIPGIDGRGNKTSPDTIALLRKVAPLFLADGYSLKIGSGYRDLRGQFKIACDAYKDGRGNIVGKYIAHPGGSFHGIGYAIDVKLMRGKKEITISGDGKLQQKERPEEAKYLAERMLSVGFRRLNNEIWHFEPANAPAASCRCYKIEDCTMPPNVGCSSPPPAPTIPDIDLR